MPFIEVIKNDLSILGRLVGTFVEAAHMNIEGLAHYFGLRFVEQSHDLVELK